MDGSPRTTAKDSQRRYAELAARPVLARLPDVSAEVELLRTEQKAAQGVGYRFDPPQGAERGSGAVHAERTARFPTLKSELIYAPRTSRAHQPHVFERSRARMRPAPASRRESPILPRSNPFAIPQRGILDSLAPFLRFATLVALFAAAGTWLQAVAFRSAPPVKPAETPSTTAQEPINPNTKTAERPADSTSAGPVKATPEPNTKIGRERENDFAKLRGDILPVTSATDTVEPAMPGLVSASGELPRVQTTELPAESADSAAARPDDAARVPEVARATRGFRVIPPLPR